MISRYERKVRSSLLADIGLASIRQVPGADVHAQELRVQMQHCIAPCAAAGTGGHCDFRRPHPAREGKALLRVNQNRIVRTDNCSSC
jgi:hypothetical protein